MVRRSNTYNSLQYTKNISNTQKPLTKKRVSEKPFKKHNKYKKKYYTPYQKKRLKLAEKLKKGPVNFLKPMPKKRFGIVITENPFRKGKKIKRVLLPRKPDITKPKTGSITGTHHFATKPKTITISSSNITSNSLKLTPALKLFRKPLFAFQLKKKKKRTVFKKSFGAYRQN